MTATTGRNESAFRPKAVASDPSCTTMPATAGPTSWATMNCEELAATAWRSRFAGTSDGTRAAVAGRAKV
jgi:hypothetical protein